jgi:predicted nuclease of predicted toxin-antitoxin system
LKVLLDTCVWGGARDELRALGHDVVWSGDWDQDTGDDEILSRAFAESRVLSARAQGRLIAQVDQYGPDLLQGAIVTAEPGRLRIRPPDRDEVP